MSTEGGVLEVTVNGVDIIGNAHVSTTTFETSVPGPAGLHLHLLNRGRYGHMWLSTHEFSDRHLGRFRVDANDRAYAACWLTEPVCAGLTAVGASRYEFELRDERATAMAPAYHEREPYALIAAVKALSALASRNAEIDTQWRRMAEAAGGRVVAHSWRPTGATSAVIPQASETVRLDVFVGAQSATEPQGLFTRLRCQRRRTAPLDYYVVRSKEIAETEVPSLPANLRALELPALTTYRASCSAYTPMTQRITPAVCTATQQVGPSLIVGDERDVSVYLRGLACDPARIRAAGHLCVELAVEVDRVKLGPYR